MTKNERDHLLGGTLVALAAVLLWAAGFSLGAFVAVCSWAAGAAVELYQRYRAEGTPSFRGAALSAAPGSALGALIELVSLLL